jgi:precorrin-6B methylase 2
MPRTTNTPSEPPSGAYSLSALPAALKALLAQGVAWALVVGLLSQGVIPSQIWALVIAQCVLAALIAFALRSERWWLVIHLGFSPLLVLAHGLQVTPGWYLAAFLMLTAIYWTSFRTRVPLYLSNQATIAALDRLIASRRPARILDLGCGTGTVLVALAHRHPDSQFTGIESAPAPYLIARLRARGQPNIQVRRGDFFATSWADQDLIYAFLSPVPMSKVGEKAMREMRPRSMLVSNSFAIPGLQTTEVIEVGDKRGTRLFVYDSECKTPEDSGLAVELAV